MRRALTAFAVMAALSSAAVAGTTIALAPGMSQPEFQQFSEDLGAAFSYRDPAPNAPRRHHALSVHVGASEALISDGGGLAAGTQDSTNHLVLSSLYLNQNLPFGIEIGGAYTVVPNSNIRLLGAEASYVLFPGNHKWPALAVRATYSRLAGVPELNFSTAGLELSISRQFGRITPYAGLGELSVNSSPRVGNLASTRFIEHKVFAGIALHLGITTLSLEGDRIGSTDSATVSLGFRF